MTVQHRKIKTITFTLDADAEGVGTPVNFECQIRTWTLTPPQEDGETFFTQCPAGEFVEDAEPVWTLELGFFSDWQTDGISDFLMKHRGVEAPFVLAHHPDDAASHVTWTGVVKLKAPPIGGEARSTEQQTVTMRCVGEPAYARGV